MRESHRVECPSVQMLLIVRGPKVIMRPLFDMIQNSHEEIRLAFGRRVRALRQERGLSQEALALRCGLDRTYVGGVERGERNISLVNIHRIARGLGLPVPDLFGKESG